MPTDVIENAEVAPSVTLPSPKQAIVSAMHGSDQKTCSGARVEGLSNSAATDQGAPGTVSIE